MITYLKLFLLPRDIYIIFNLDVPDDIKPDISHTQNQHILYVFSFEFCMTIVVIISSNEREETSQGQLPLRIKVI
jgi:hypothetical protein